jgi:hypothetical protein
VFLRFTINRQNYLKLTDIAFDYCIEQLYEDIMVSLSEESTESENYAGQLYFHPTCPERVTVRTWIWAAKHGFDDIRKFAYTRCEKDIYKALGTSGIDKMEQEGVPRDILKTVLERAARLAAT